MNRVQKQIQDLVFEHCRTKIFAITWLDFTDISDTHVRLENFAIEDLNSRYHSFNNLKIEMTIEEMDSLHDQSFAWPYNELLEFNQMRQSYLKFLPRLTEIAAQDNRVVREHINAGFIIPLSDPSMPFIFIGLPCEVISGIEANKLTYKEDNDI